MAKNKEYKLKQQYYQAPIIERMYDERQRKQFDKDYYMAKLHKAKARFTWRGRSIDITFLSQQEIEMLEDISQKYAEKEKDKPKKNEINN